MPNVEVRIPAGIGEGVQIRTGEWVGQLAMVVAWCVTRSRFLLGGALDRAPQVSLLVITEQRDERWLDAAEVLGLSEPAVVTFFLPFTGGDEVLVAPSRSPGEIRGWEVTSQRLETNVVYRVHLTSTPAEDEIEVEARSIEPRPRV